MFCLQFEQSLVEGPGEEDVQQVLVDQGQAEDSAAEAEPVEVVVDERRDRRNLEVSISMSVSCLVWIENTSSGYFS